MYTRPNVRFPTLSFSDSFLTQDISLLYDKMLLRTCNIRRVGDAARFSSPQLKFLYLLFIVLHCKQTQATKRTRLLIRQPRVKKEPSHLSPDGETSPSPHIVSTSVHLATPTLNLPQTSRSFEESRISPPPHTMLVNQPNLLTVSTSSNLLTVPQPTYLTKQHSHPLLSSQQSSTSGTYWIQRQHSHPELPGRTTSPSIVIEPAPVPKTDDEGSEEAPATITSEPGTSSGGGGGGSTSGGLRVKIAELRRTSSSPQVDTKQRIVVIDSSK